MHVITDLDTGGAELMLKRLVEAQKRDSSYQHHTVVSLKEAGEVGRQLAKLGVEVRSLRMSSKMGFLRAIWRLAGWIRACRADIVQTWLYHADLIGGLASRLAGNCKLVWCVRNTATPQRGVSATGLAVWLCARLSGVLPDVIVCCAESARSTHEDKGYDATKMMVVPNGYDLQAFRETPELREQSRGRFGFGENESVVGTVGRFDRLKDYRNFVRAMAMLASELSDVKFLMVGRGLNDENDLLRSWLMESGMPERFVLAGERRDVAACLAAMDVFCLSSLAEAFPNVVCEAMAMKLPCVATDVGDVAKIVGETGIVVKPENPEEMAAGLREMLKKSVEERARIGATARERVRRNYSMEIVKPQFDAIYARLLQDSAAACEGFEATQTQ
jgi:glycosyltransferase involved in cell wall biosynthesis